VGRHRHAVTVRADGLGAVLGPLLNDPRIVLAALVDVDSGMVLDACTPERPGARYLGADLELTGAGHAELIRVALALPGRAGPAVAGDELIASAGPDRHHLLLALPDPHGGRLVLSVVVDGSRRLAQRVLRKLRAVPVETLTAGPTVVRRPGVGGWVSAGADAPGRPDQRPAGHTADFGHDGGPDFGPRQGFEQLTDHGVDHRFDRADQFPDHLPDRDRGGVPGAGRPTGRGFEHVPHLDRPVGPGGDVRAARPGAADPFALRVEVEPARPVAGALFEPAARDVPGPAAGFGPVRRPPPRPYPDPLAHLDPLPRPAPVGGAGVAPIGLVEPPPVAAPPRPPDDDPPRPAQARPPAPPSALPPGRPG
jgi:hypothetical protein